jgi:vancomycin resistance protein YoaR
MTTTTPETVLVPTPDVPETRRPSTRFRFAVAFLIGLLVATAIGVGALYAYDRHYDGRILPGVTIGSTDLSGLDAAAAGAAIRQAYGYLADGSITLRGEGKEKTISFADIGRGPDVEAMVAVALAVGRDGNLAERLISDVRTALRGIVLAPKVTFDADKLADEAVAFADSLERQPHDAFVSVLDKQYTVVNAVEGRLADPATPVEQALTDLGSLDAPAQLSYEVPVSVVPPTVTTEEATTAKADAERITAPIKLLVDDKAHHISGGRLRNWLTFGPTADGGYGVSLDATDLPTVLKTIAKKVDKAPVNASFTSSGGRITGVTSSADGYRLDQKKAHQEVQALLDARAAGAATASLEPSLKVIAPALTTAEAKAARPKMRKISQWTTYFPIGEKNGFGANIWIPARLINGHVVAPGATFDFWDAVGSVTRAKGFRAGGAIINGRTEPQGALAGGICSCSTTLFNAAARAGYQMGARRNHYYYIDRYPVGLDATVFISASGSKQTMSFTNDTDYPLLIRGTGWRNGGKGYVKFEIYTVPHGRRVSFATGPKRNYRSPSDVVQYTSSLPQGAAKRVEYPVAGFQVSVTRTVRDRKGKVIHRDTWFSNYATITGVTLIGR